MKVSIWRGGPENGGFEEFDAPRRDSQTVLDVVAWVQENVDPTLSYRFACRVGMCGSCAMMVNGRPRWTCRTHVSKVVQDDRLTIAPLKNLPVIKDLAVDMDPFFEKWTAAEARHHPAATHEDPVAPVDPASAARKVADAAIECINCAVCYAACDTVAANPGYLGPAALNRAWTVVNDEKNGDRVAVLDAVSGESGCHNCHSIGGCAVYCPNELNPMASIAGLKRVTLKRGLGF